MAQTIMGLFKRFLQKTEVNDKARALPRGQVLLIVSHLIQNRKGGLEHWFICWEAVDWKHIPGADFAAGAAKGLAEPWPLAAWLGRPILLPVPQEAPPGTAGW
jgi:hypothetical protein